MPQTLYVVLGAGKPVNQNVSISLQKIHQNKSTLEHQINTANELNFDLIFVSGYQHSKITQKFPQLNCVYNENWQSTSSAYSLYTALTQVAIENYDNVIVSYSDVITNIDFLKDNFNSSDSKISILVNREAPSRLSKKRKVEILSIEGRDLEYSGLMKFDIFNMIKLLKYLKTDIDKFENVSVSSLLNEYLTRFALNSEVNLIEARKNWAHLEHSVSMARFSMGSKADTLKSIFGKLEHSYVLPIYVVKKASWMDMQNDIAEEIIHKFQGEPLIVRSSSINEDNSLTSGAGKFLSLTNIRASTNDIIRAIDEVFLSYGVEMENPDSEVLVQPILKNISMVGVAMTRSIPNSGPYYVIEFTANQNTESITGGHYASREIWKVLRTGYQNVDSVPNKVKKIIKSLSELEEKFFNDKLDVEFALDKNGEVVIFQVRQIVVRDNKQSSESDELIFSNIYRAEKSLKSGTASGDPHSNAGYFLSNMSDWNPAEIIGKQPTKLAFDLYNYLVTGQTWALQRKESGYSFPQEPQLVFRILGKAFVDIKKTIWSFIPQKVAPEIKEFLLKEALNYMDQNNQLHDKIEFQVLPTSINFSKKSIRQDFLYLKNLNENDYQGYIRELTLVTCNIIDNILRNKDLINLLTDRSGVENDEKQSLRDRLDYCREEGVLKFAHFARGAFVATSFMNSAVKQGILSERRLVEFWGSLNGLTSRLTKDAYEVKIGKLKLNTFLERYGHLRPGTYNIESPSYKENIEQFIKPLIENAESQIEKNFKLTNTEKRAFQQNLHDIGVTYTADDFLDFVITAINGREIMKLHFTKTLSDSMNEIIRVGANLGLTREELKHLDLELIFKLFGDCPDKNVVLNEARATIENNMLLFELNSKIEMPDYLSEKIDLKGFKIMDHQPNFPAKRNATSSLLKIESVDDIELNDLSGKIVAIENADPGYEFLFASPIAGLITAYGGPNSHMAIRCAEQNLPAAIGIGSDAFGNLNDGCLVEINSTGLFFRKIN